MTLRSLLSEESLETLCEEARRAPVGAIVEVGVYRGGSAARLYEVARQQGRELYLFDTFAGHPYVDDVDDHALGRFKDAIHPEDLRERLPGAHVIAGIFPDSLMPMEPVAFVHADADLYRVTRDICLTLPPLMVSGGVLLFDDYSHHDCKGCRLAVDECLPEREVLVGGRARVVVR